MATSSVRPRTSTVVILPGGSSEVKRTIIFIASHETLSRPRIINQAVWLDTVKWSTVNAQAMIIDSHVHIWMREHLPDSMVRAYLEPLNALKDLFDWFKALGITVLVISENVPDEWDEDYQGEAYLSDGILELLMREMGDSRVQRWVRCVKMRGANVDNRYYTMFHDGREFSLSLPLAPQPCVR